MALTDRQTDRRTKRDREREERESETETEPPWQTNRNALQLPPVKVVAQVVARAQPEPRGEWREEAEVGGGERVEEVRGEACRYF